MPTVTAPDKGQLEYIGNFFIQESRKLDDLAQQLKIGKFTPGSSAAALELQKRFKDRMDGLIIFLTNLAAAFRQLGTQMIKMAAKYQGVEDLNKEDAERLAQLIDSMKEQFPGIETVIPKDIPDIPGT